MIYGNLHTYLRIYKSRSFLQFCYKNVSRNNIIASIFVSWGNKEARITCKKKENEKNLVLDKFDNPPGMQYYQF